MQAWKLLFSSDVGLFSVAVFIAIFAMIGYFTWLFAFKKDTSESADDAQQSHKHAHT